MAKPKRTPLAFNTNELTNELKESAGKGVDAFFSSPLVQSPQPRTELPSLAEPEPLEIAPPISNTPVTEEKRNKTTSTDDRKKRPRPTHITRNITILHL